MFPLHLHFTELAYLVRSSTSGPVFGYRAEDLPAPDHPRLAEFVEEGARRLEERGLLQRGIAGGDRLPPDLEALARCIARPAVGVLLVRRKKDGDERCLYQVDSAGFALTRMLGDGRWEVDRPLHRKDFLAIIQDDIGEMSPEPPPEQAALTFFLPPEAILELDHLRQQGRREEALGMMVQLGVDPQAAARWLHASDDKTYVSALLYAHCVDAVIDDVYSLTVVHSPPETWLVKVSSPDNPALQVSPTSKGEVFQLIERYYYELVFATLSPETP